MSHSMRWESLCLAAAIFTLYACPALAGGDMWWVGPANVSELHLPERIGSHEVVRRDLGYDFAQAPTRFLGGRSDLNGDGVPDYIIRSAQGLCGTGGCIFAVFDGATHSYMGPVFGNMVRARPSRVTGWAVLEAFSRTSAQVQTYTVHVVVGSRYQAIAHLTVVSEQPLWEAAR